MTQACSGLPNLPYWKCHQMAMAAGLFNDKHAKYNRNSQVGSPGSLSVVLFCFVLFCWRVFCFVLDMEWRMNGAVRFTSTIGQKGIYWLSNNSQFFQSRNYQKPYQNPKAKSLDYFYSLRENTKVLSPFCKQGN